MRKRNPIVNTDRVCAVDFGMTFSATFFFLSQKWTDFTRPSPPGLVIAGSRMWKAGQASGVQLVGRLSWLVHILKFYSLE